ncbi:MAG: hypothetical protein RL662_2199 [Bacteroidota bacterium]|jgi:hypothetical protein
MKEFVSHIDYLIQKHDCVIIPDFGGFVLSHEGAAFTRDGLVLPPKITIGFNPELRYNDGLLAESYMNMYSIPYDVACKRIYDAVKRLNAILAMQHPVQIGNLGKLLLDKSDRLSFSPNENLSLFHPETFGLSPLNIRRLVDIEKTVIKSNQRVILNRALAGIGTAAAAVLLFFVASTPVKETIDTQKSSFFTDLVTSSTQPVAQTSIVTEEASAEEVAVEISSTISTENEVVLEPSPIVKARAADPAMEDVKKKVEVVESPIVNKEKEKSNNFFLIVGGSTKQSEVQRLLKKMKSQGFSEADVLKSKDRTRVYVASFTTANDAEQYLETFKANNPRLSDAWIYQKN